ncbi:MAG: addiction module killer protein [Chitinophagaceae bacterium]|nr:MAG: addiction module killer protein [Chitinophagaceae bacterium]
MTVYFKDQYLEDLYDNMQRGKPRYNQEVVRKFRERVNFLIEAKNTGEVRAMKSLHFEQLSGDKSGLYSMRINKYFRLEFSIDKEVTIQIEEVIIIHKLSNHYK